MTEVTVGGQTLELALPPLARRSAIRLAWADAGSDLQVRVLVISAALFLCSPEAQRKEGAPAYEQRVLRYGEAVYEYLVEHGAQDAEIAEAGMTAVNMVLASFPTEADHEEARGNSPAPSGG